MKFIQTLCIVNTVVLLCLTNVFADEREIKVPDFVHAEITEGQKVIANRILELSINDGFMQIERLMINLTDQVFVKNSEGIYSPVNNSVLKEGLEVAVIYTSVENEDPVQAIKVWVLGNIDKKEGSSENNSQTSEESAQSDLNNEKTIKLEDGVWKN